MPTSLHAVFIFLTLLCCPFSSVDAVDLNRNHQGCRGCGDSSGDSHGYPYGYGMGMGTGIQFPRQSWKSCGLLDKRSCYLCQLCGDLAADVRSVGQYI